VIAFESAVQYMPKCYRTFSYWTHISNMIIWWPFCPQCWCCHTRICSKLAFVQPTTRILLLGGRKQNVAAFRAQIKMPASKTSSPFLGPPWHWVHILRYCI